MLFKTRPVETRGEEIFGLLGVGAIHVNDAAVLENREPNDYDHQMEGQRLGGKERKRRFMHTARNNREHEGREVRERKETLRKPGVQGQRKSRIPQSGNVSSMPYVKAITT